MGILGSGFDDPQTQFNLALASGLLSSRGGLGQAFGQALPMAVQARQQGQAAIAQRQNDAIKQQLMLAQIEDEKAQAAKRAADVRAMQEDLANQAGLQQYFSSLGTVNLPGGPTNEAAATVKPKEFDINEFLKLPGAMRNMPMAKTYMEAKDFGKPSFSHFEKVVTPEGERIAGISKTGDSKLFDLTPRPQTPQMQVNMGDRTFDQEMTKLAVGNIAKSSAIANAAVQNIDAISKMKGALSGGILPTGPGASATQVMSRLADASGLGGKDNAERLANTATLIQSASKLAVEAAASMKGQGSFSNEERRLLAKAAIGGEEIMSMRPSEIQMLINALEKSSRKAIESHKQLLSKVDDKMKRWLPLIDVEMPPELPALQQPSLPTNQSTPGSRRQINRPPVNWSE